MRIMSRVSSFLRMKCEMRLLTETGMIAIRAMREAARTWGDVHEKYLAAAVRFSDDFEGWF